MRTRGNDQTLEPWLARLTDSCRHASQSPYVAWSGSLYGCVLEETSWSSPPPTVVKARRSFNGGVAEFGGLGSKCPKSRPEVGWDPTILHCKHKILNSILIRYSVSGFLLKCNSYDPVSSC